MCSSSSSLSTGPGPLITFARSTDALASLRLRSFLLASSDPDRRAPDSLPSLGVSGALPELLSPVELGGLITNGLGPGLPTADLAMVIRPRSSTEREPLRLLVRVTPTPGTRRAGRGGGATPAMSMSGLALRESGGPKLGRGAFGGPKLGRGALARAAAAAGGPAGERAIEGAAVDAEEPGRLAGARDERGASSLSESLFSSSSSSSSVSVPTAGARI